MSVRKATRQAFHLLPPGRSPSLNDAKNRQTGCPQAPGRGVSGYYGRDGLHADIHLDLLSPKLLGEVFNPTARPYRVLVSRSKGCKANVPDVHKDWHSLRTKPGVNKV